MSIGSQRRVSLRKKISDNKRIDDLLLKRHSFSDIVNAVNRELVHRYDEKIERKKYSVLIGRVANLVNEFDYFIPGIPQSKLVEQIVDSITGYDILHPFIANINITNIEVEGPHDVYVMENLRWRHVPVSFGNEKRLEDYIHRLFNRLKGRFTLDSPLAKVEDGEWNLRIRAGGFDLRPDSPTLSIRKLRKDPLSAEEIRYAMSENMEAFVRFAVRAGYTIGTVGPFGSGKTTLMGTMLSWAPTTKHIGLIQSANEIQKVHPFMRRSLTRERTGERGRQITESDLLEFAKQEMYQIIALGEFLNESALNMLHILQLRIQAFFTYHANDPRGSIHSFIFMMKMAGGGYDVDYLLQELAKNMDLVIIMDRLRVKEIIQFTGEVDRGSYMPVYESIYKFEVQEENRHELIGDWKRDFSVKLCEKLVDKAKWNGAAIPPELQLV